MRMNHREVYNKRDSRWLDSLNGSDGMRSREAAFDEGNGRGDLRQAYHKNGYRMQKSLSGSDGMSSRDEALDEENDRKNTRQVYNKSGFRIKNCSRELKGSTKEEVYDLRLERDGM